MPTFETTLEQRHQLSTDGYTLLPDALPPELLTHWKKLAATLETRAMQAHERGESMRGSCVVNDPVGQRLMRCDDIHEHDSDAVLELLACPGMMAVARELCGRGTVPMQIDIVYKQQHPHPVILWHQGAQHPRGYPYLNVGVYLDDAPAGDGCLRYVPGTQSEPQDICGLSEAHGWEIPGVVEQPARAGDILVQDMMILHGSQPKRTLGVRRTVYVEFRPVAGILESGKQSAAWAELRKRWMGLVLRRADPGDWPESWRQDIPSDLGSDDEEIEKILSRPEPPIPARYCHYGIETEGYPVPSDMKT